MGAGQEAEEKAWEAAPPDNRVTTYQDCQLRQREEHVPGRAAGSLQITWGTQPPACNRPLKSSWGHY